MPQETGYVSLWTGIAASDDAIEEYLTFHYTEDGDAIPSQFGKDFGIEWFDEDFREAGFKNRPTSSLHILLGDHSDASQLIPKFVELYGKTLDQDSNVLVLLFDFHYDGGVSEMKEGPVQLIFRGCIQER